MSTRYGRIQVRHDSAEHWVAHNPVLFEGEWGFETDTGQAKIGVGKTWIETDYFSGHQDDLAAQLAAEKEDRQNADAAIENHIARVKEGCEQADQSLAEHNDETNQRLAGEIDDRITGDKNLQVQVARLADEFDKLLAGIDDIDGEQIEIILQSAARLEDLNALNEKLEKEKAYRIEADEQEKKAREDADLALNELIADEAKAREEADEALKGDFEEDQLRQDEETKARDAVLEAEIIALAAKTKEDQDRQDTAIDDLEKALYGAKCDPENITTELVFGYWNDGDDITKVYWTGDYLNLPYGSNFGWRNPSAPVDCPDALYINGVKHEVTQGSNWSGMHWNYYLATAPDAALAGEIVTVSQCPPSPAQFVTQDELKADQDRQDHKLADYKQEVQEDQDRQDKALQDEIDARVQRDSLHDAEIDTLEYKLDALLGLTFRGTYEFKHEADCDAEYATCMAAAGGDINAQQACTRDYVSCEQDKVRAGYFEAVDPDDQFDHLEQIVISKNDASGVEVDWAGVLDAGDYLEVDHVFAGSLDKTNYGLYRITEEPEVTTNAHGEEVYTMKLQFLQGDGVMLEGEKYEIRGITAAEGVNPEELADFLTKEEAAAKYLSLSGGTLAGTLNMKDAAAIKTRHLDSGNNSDLAIKRNGQRRILVGTENVLFDKIPRCAANPSADNDLTRKAWIVSNYAAKTHSHTNYASTSHTHSGYASSSHNHDSSYVKGNYTITKSGKLYLIS